MTVSRRSKDGVLVEQDLDVVLQRLRSSCTAACVKPEMRRPECDLGKGLLKAVLRRAFTDGVNFLRMPAG